MKKVRNDGDEIQVERDGNGWRLVDRKGKVHSARIVLGGKARAQRQADALNATLRKVRDGFDPKRSR